MSRVSNGPINSSYRYRSSGRRQYYVDKKFQRKVALSQGHTLIYKQFGNIYNNGIAGQCTWADLDLGKTTDVALLRDFALTHWAGYKEADPNTGFLSTAQFPLKFKVMDHSVNYQGLNSGTNKIHITVYTCTLKHDINSDVMFPGTAIVGFSDEARLKQTGSDAQNPFDVNLTPYMVPAVTAHYKISKSRSFTVHAGGSFNIKLRHSYDCNVGTDSTVGWSGQSTLVAKKGQYRCLLIKIVGQLGVVEGSDPPNTAYLRNTAFQAVGRINTVAKIHVSEENRPIHWQQLTSRTRNLAGLNSTLGEEILVPENTFGLNINTTA